MKSSYKVSVILPCYNGAKWIGRSLQSVLAQTYRDIEILIINDGSTDNSERVITPYLLDKRVRYLCQKNKGFSAAINSGIKKCIGDYVGFIGQDDLWLSHKLKAQINYIKAHQDVNLVYSDYCSIDSEGRPLIQNRKAKICDLSSREKTIKRLFLNNFIGFETVLVAKKCFNEVGLFDERMIAFSDYDMWLRIAGIFDIGYLGMSLVKKRQHKTQLSKVRINQAINDEFLIMAKTIERYPFLKKSEHKKLASLYYSRGIAFMQKGKFNEAKQDLLKTVRCQPWKLKATFAYLAPKLYSRILNSYKQFAQTHVSLNWLDN